MDKILEFANILKQSKNAVFFGGAGVSTESGVKDYRSKDGLYNTVKEYGFSPEIILSHAFFESSPKVFYDFYYKYFLSNNVEPNPAHIALAKLESAGKLSGVITQNVDGLHQRAGSRNVFELHGSASKHYCSLCKADFPTSAVAELKGEVPYCDKCGGVVRPDVVLYQERLNESVIDGAVSAIANADLLIVGGTSLAVYHAASFLEYFNGNNIVLINKGETPYDDRAKLVFRDSIGKVLSAAVDIALKA